MILFKLLGNTISDNSEHHAKQVANNSSVVLGKLTVFNCLHLLKALSGILVIPSGIIASVILVLAKQYFSKEVIDSGILLLSRDGPRDSCWLEQENHELL